MCIVIILLLNNTVDIYIQAYIYNNAVYHITFSNHFLTRHKNRFHLNLKNVVIENCVIYIIYIGSSSYIITSK